MMRERMGRWATDLSPEDFAWTLLALGLVLPELQEGNASTSSEILSALRERLGGEEGPLRWSLDIPADALGTWGLPVTAQALAQLVRSAPPGTREVQIADSGIFDPDEVVSYFAEAPECAGLRSAAWTFAQMPRWSARPEAAPLLLDVQPPPEEVPPSDETPPPAPPPKKKLGGTTRSGRNSRLTELLRKLSPKRSPRFSPPDDTRTTMAPAGAREIAAMLEAELPAAPAPRYFQTAVLSPSDQATPIAVPLDKDADYLARVFIGQLRPGYLHADESFPTLEPEPSGEPHELSVVFSEPMVCPKPVVQRMLLGSAETDEAGCEFPFHSPSEAVTLHARVTVVHRKRVLQTGILDIPVGLSRDAPAFHLDAVPRALLNNLGARTEFDAAFVFDDADGSGVAHDVASEKPMVFDMADTSIKSLLDTYDIAITQVSSSPDDYDSLESTATVGLLRSLAQVGASAREYLASQQGEGYLTRSRRVQVISAKPGALFPIELLYDLDAPEDTAALCPRAKEALGPEGPTESDEWCDGCSPTEMSPEKLRMTLCPLAFWGFRGVVERKTFEPQDRVIGGEFALAPEPGQDTDDVLHPLACAVVGTATQVLPEDAKAMVAQIRKRVGLLKVASGWDGLMAEVREEPAPSLLALVAHQERDPVSGAPVLHIGSGPGLKSDLLRPEHVRPNKDAKPPVALVLGCETALSDIDFQSFFARFKLKGAAVVVGTLASVLGRHAAPVAADLVECIASADTSTSFGVIMRDVRRRALLRGMPMALALVSIGDADWNVDGTK